jgi:hypothetical protein
MSRTGIQSKASGDPNGLLMGKIHGKRLLPQNGEASEGGAFAADSYVRLQSLHILGE